MQPTAFILKMLAPNRDWYHGPATRLRLSTEEGEMEVLPGHASLVGLVDFTLVRIENNEHVQEFYARGGTLVVEAGGEEVRFMAQDIQPKSEMDITSIEGYLNFILERLKSKDHLTKYQVKFLEEQQGHLEKSIAVIKTQK